MSENRIEIELIESNLDNWIELQRLSELSDQTLKQYRNAVNKFINYLHTNKIEFVSKGDMILYKKYLNDISNSFNSKNIWIIGLNKYLKYLNQNELCIKQIKRQKKFYIHDNLTYSDYKRLLRIAKKENRMQDYYIMKILAMTGIRISELYFFTVENLKKQNGNILHIYNKGKERDVPLRDDLARDLRKYCRDNKIVTGTIFPSPKLPEKMINEATIYKHLKKIAGKAKVKLKVTHPHSFRHLFADIFLSTYPENILMLADLLGHNSLETTRIYTTKTPGQQKEMLKKLKF